MARRAAAIVALVVLGFSLTGCSQCGWIWDDWRSPGACRSDRMPEK
jgi:hypothetical protein